MAEIKPFNGLRFKLDSPGELGKRIAPPYDMLDKAMIGDLYARDPFNIVRVTQNRPEATDTENKDRHVRAAATLSAWIKNGILRRDDQPSVYVYEQKFSYTSGSGVREAVRTGVIVLVKLVDFAEKVVLPHEATLSGPKKDRYELLEAGKTHTEQIFGLLDDQGPFFKKLCGLVSETPDGIFTDDNGVVHSLFRCSDQESIATLVKLAEGKTILIADGHHRYETALNYYKANPRPEHAYTMMTLVSTADPGLLIRPFHRLVRKAGRTVDMKRSLADYFTMKDYGAANSATVYDFLETSDATSMLYLDSEERKLYGCIPGKSGEAFLASIMPEKSMLWKQLPVSMINVIVINTILGLALDGAVLHDVVDYMNDVGAAVDQCAGNETYYGGFFLRPSTIVTVGSVVAAGERMPQKSTNFFPKIFSGLVLYKMG